MQKDLLNSKFRNLAKKIFFLSISTLLFLSNSSLVWAQEVQKQLETKIVFQADGTAKISYDKHGKSADETTTNKIQTALLFYGYGMHALEQSKRMALLNATQKIVFAVGSEQGLMRADVIEDNTLAKIDGEKLKGRGFDLTFGSVAGKGNTLQVQEIGDKDPNLYLPATFWLFQDLIKNLPANGVRILVLALGSTNKWYREHKNEIGNPSSITAASTHGLKTAVEIMEAFAGKKSS